MAGGGRPLGEAGGVVTLVQGTERWRLQLQSMSAWLRKRSNGPGMDSPASRPQTLGHCADPALLPLGTIDSGPQWHGVGQEARLARKRPEPTSLDPHPAIGGPTFLPNLNQGYSHFRGRGLSLEQLSHDAAHGPDVH